MIMLLRELRSLNFHQMVLKTTLSDLLSAPYFPLRIFTVLKNAIEELLNAFQSVFRETFH